MSRFDLAAQTPPTTPASGIAAVYFDSTTKRLTTRDDTGMVRTQSFVNFSTSSQSPSATTRTYITGSSLNFAAGRLQVGTILRWSFNLTKTAAGVASSTFDIAFGTAGTTSDTARVSFTKPGGSAAIDEGRIVIEAIVRGPVGASGVVAGHFNMTHNLSATGHMTIPVSDSQVQSSAFDITTPTFVGICITSGASDAVTIQQVIAEAINL